MAEKKASQPPETKKFYYDNARKLGYRGQLTWREGTKEDWKREYERLLFLPTGDRALWKAQRAIEPPPIDQVIKDIDRDDTPLFVERIDKDKPKVRRVRFPVAEYIADNILTVNNVHAFANFIIDLFENVHAETGQYQPAYQIGVIGNGRRMFSTHYTLDINDLREELMEKLQKFAEDYENALFGGDAITINDVEINYLTDAPVAIRGVERGRMEMNEKYIIIDTPTRKNCLFVAIYTSLNWHEQLLTCENKRIRNGAQWKLRMFPNGPDIPTFDDIPGIARRVGVTVEVYSDLGVLLMREVAGGRIARIMVARGHARALIPRDTTLPVEVDIREEKAIKKERLSRRMRYDNIKNKEYVPFEIGEIEVCGKENVIFSRFTVGGVTIAVEEFENWVAATFGNKNGNIYVPCHKKCEFFILLRDVIFRSRLKINKIIDCDGDIIGFSLLSAEKRLINFKDSLKMFDGNIREFGNVIYKKFGISIADCYTISSLAKKVCIDKLSHLKQRIPLHNLSGAVDKYIRRSYNGGRCECFIIGRVDGPVYHYDFTSLYPFVGTFLLPTGEPNWQVYSAETIEDALKRNNMGFIRVIVTSKKRSEQTVDGNSLQSKGGEGGDSYAREGGGYFHLPLHGIHHDGQFIFPHIRTPTEMILFTQEIREGLEYYNYIPLDGYAFGREPVLRDFFRELHVEKMEARKRGDEAMMRVWKLFLNSGYGFWGYNHNDKSCLIMPKCAGEWASYLADGKLRDLSSFGETVFYRVDNDKRPEHSNVAVASAITSYGRILLWRALVAARNAGCRIYYCDTDSIIVDRPLDDLAGPIGDLVRRPAELGGLKLEGCYPSANILSCKVYSLGDDVHKMRAFTGKVTGDDIKQFASGELTQTSDVIIKNISSCTVQQKTVVKMFASTYSKGIINKTIKGEEGGGGSAVTPLLI